MDSRKHQHEEEKRTRKLKKLLEKLDGAIEKGATAKDAVNKVLEETAKSLESNAIYQAWKCRN